MVRFRSAVPVTCPYYTSFVRVSSEAEAAAAPTTAASASGTEAEAEAG